MRENKKLIYWMLGIFSTTFLLIIGVMAHDRQIDKCIVDHLFDFHLDVEHIQEEHEKDKINREEEKKIQEDNLRRQQEWADEIRSCWRDSDSSDGEGTSCERENNDSNRDR